MTSRGHAETEQLRLNLEGQLERLVQQLSDLESCRSELDDCEYNETKKDTMEQLHELNESLSKMVSGDMTLIDEFSAMQLATQAAISAAFRTPAVIRMFARREPVLLRQRLSDIERDIKLGKNIYNDKMEVLNALRQLGEKLSVTELRALEEYSSVSLSDAAGFVQVSDRGVTGQEALDMASREAESVEGRN